MNAVTDTTAWLAAQARARQTDQWRAMFRNTRPWSEDVHDPDTGITTMTVKRACNGCNRMLGDVSQADLDALYECLPLPDVTGECGCTPHTVCAHCLHGPGPEPCCPSFDGTTTTMTERALRVFRKDLDECRTTT